MTCTPKRLKTAAALEYLAAVHGIELTDKTLRNWRCQGRGPRWEYLGNTPYTTPAELDRAVDAMLTDRPANGRKRFADSADDQPEAA
jgi:hypothetical protein